jgi:hypothetical protein
MIKIRLLIALVVAVSGCAVTATRPVQEMYYADAALRAARDLHADTLVPELYRAASEAHSKAKREYRLKSFEKAKDFAVRAMRLAEKAEFEAYRLGGATPEVMSTIVQPEGAVADPDEAIRRGMPEPSAPDPVPADEPTANAPGTDGAESAPGTDYNEYMREQEAAKKRSEAPAAPTPPASAPTSPPSGPTGPIGASTQGWAAILAVNTVRSAPQDRRAEPPILPGGRGLEGFEQKQGPLDTDRWILQEPTQMVPFSPMNEVPSEPIPDVGERGIPELGNDARPVIDGIDEVPISDANTFEDLPDNPVQKERNKK